MKPWILAAIALALVAIPSHAGCRVVSRRAVIVQRPAVVVARRNVVLVNRTATLVVPSARTRVIVQDYVGVSAFLVGGYGGISVGSPAPAPAPAVDLSPVLKSLEAINARLDKLESAEPLPKPAPAPEPKK